MKNRESPDFKSLEVGISEIAEIAEISEIAEPWTEKTWGQGCFILVEL